MYFPNHFDLFIFYYNHDGLRLSVSKLNFNFMLISVTGIIFSVLKCDVIVKNGLKLFSVFGCEFSENVNKLVMMIHDC